MSSKPLASKKDDKYMSSKKAKKTSKSRPLASKVFKKNETSSLERSSRPSLLVLFTVLLAAIISLNIWPIKLNGKYLISKKNTLKYKNKGDYQTVIEGRNGAVATEEQTCSLVGTEILKAGGNAVDAAIASGICIGAVNSFSSGIGGGGFMLIRHPNGTANSLNFRETAPSGSYKDMFHGNPNVSQVGGLSVAVPGEIAGYEVAWKLYGKLPWAKLFEPTIHLMKYGMPMPKELASRLRRPEFDYFKTHPTWSKVYAPNGRFLKAGETFYRPTLAATLEEVSKYGAEVFYKGSIAKRLVDFVQEEGGILTLEDMANFSVIVENPVYGNFEGREVITCGAPCSGEVLILGLNILSEVDFSQGNSILGCEITDLGLHQLIETMKWMSAGRTLLGDPTFFDNSQHVLQLLSKRHADDIRENISPNRTYDFTHYHAEYDFPQNHGTTHLSVIDKDGMAVGLTASINLLFGAQIMEPGTGIILNDHMDDFASPGIINAFGLSPSPYNFIQPGKRPQSSAVPTILVNNGTVEMVLGGSGGSRIVTAVLDTIIKKYKWNKSLLDSIESPRFHHQLMPNIAYIDETVEDEVRLALEKFGHVIDLIPVRSPFSEIQAVFKSNNTLYAVSDSRKQAVAAAY
ncbi:gamma-glutamyltranspeptidase Ggt1 [Schizosaccharomyces octosporus yFS286]|uniref:Glutathione hydrolase n=1 Tax=Schizosaccharomyces octosporus (strain yFS286) TaxID=483514 RepID=S9PUX3_SCHOY|nr:gamma-glutamyltranspeptidase Ggt1 [Schizosaccharomyces octosporus yFS286]EPX71318.1 gamma-glutamyltranspeptidase Ggt1 [Schizosaccharomyces octosporus yFS286]